MTVRAGWIAVVCAVAAVVGCGEVREPQAKPDTTFTIPYVLLTIFYELPGDRSAIAYDGASSLSTKSRWTLAKRDGTRLAVQIDQDANDDAPFTLEEKDGAVLSARRGSVVLGYATNDGADAPDHARDAYQLLLALPANETADGAGQGSVRVNASAGTPVSLSIADLKSLERRSPETPAAAQAAAFITAEDATALLALDPFVSGASIDAAPARYVLAQPAPLALPGPDRAGDSLPLSSTRIDVPVSNGDATPASAPLFELTTVIIDGIDATLEIAYTAPALGTRPEDSAATLTLGTDNLCTRGTVSPYLDRALGSYLTVPSFSDQCGGPAGNAIIHLGAR